jgi:cell division septum initiation protein DivIVA
MADFKTPAPAPTPEPTLFPTYDQLVQENEDLKQQIADLEQQIENLKQQNAKLGEDAALWKSLYDEESDANDKLRRENAVLEE